jgi:hypothetical protein
MHFFEKNRYKFCDIKDLARLIAAFGELRAQGME